MAGREDKAATPRRLQWRYSCIWTINYASDLYGFSLYSQIFAYSSILLYNIALGLIIRVFTCSLLSKVSVIKSRSNTLYSSSYTQAKKYHLPPWIGSFDLSWHRCIVIVSLGVHEAKYQLPQLDTQWTAVCMYTFVLLKKDCPVLTTIILHCILV